MRYNHAGMLRMMAHGRRSIETAVFAFAVLACVTACSTVPVKKPDQEPKVQVPAVPEKTPVQESKDQVSPAPVEKPVQESKDPAATVPVKTPVPAPKDKVSSPTGPGYVIQVGAFKGKGRADRYISQLKSRDVEAFAVQNKRGLWTVRTGNFSYVTQARARADILHKQKKIEDFFIVNTRKGKRRSNQDNLSLEDRILRTARGYLGVRYKWGGTSAKSGFDCSGFTLVVFKKNGIVLPRHSSHQYQIGEPVKKKDLKKGDLVFFATGMKNQISHVGIYIGKGRFIHASIGDKCIRTADMTQDYFSKRYRGACRVTHLGSG